MHKSGATRFLAFGAGLHLLGQTARLEASAPSSGHDRTIAAIAACGVRAAHVRITYEDELQSDLVRFSDLGGDDEARFHCLRKATFPFYIVDVSAAPQREAYYSFDRREGAKLARAEARDWLKTAGLLDRVPRYDPRKGLNVFAREVEAACSIRAGHSLEIYGSSGLTVRRQFFGNFMTTKIHDDLTCLLRMYSASNADAHDITLAFIGNAAPSDGKQ